MTIKEIRIRPISELNHLLSELRKKMEDMRFKANQKQLKNIREIRIVKADIARELMVIQEKRQEK